MRDKNYVQVFNSFRISFSDYPFHMRGSTKIRLFLSLPRYERLCSKKDDYKDVSVCIYNVRG